MAQDSALLDWKFKSAVKYIQGLPPSGPYDPSNDEKLLFYSYFKQATEGPNKKKKPAFYDIIAKAKWDAWTKVSKLSRDDAKKKYIALFLEVAKKINTEESKKVIKEINEGIGAPAGAVKPKATSGNDNVVHIYGILLSQPTRSVIWFCKINNIPHEYHPLNLAAGAHKTPEFTKINPLQKVPAIVHRGVSYYESHTILRYLAATFPVAPNWYPSDSQSRLQVELYLDWHHLNTRKACAELFFTKFLLPIRQGINPTPEQVTRLESQLQQVLRTIDSVFLPIRPYLAGYDPTIADLLAYNEIIQLDLLGDNKLHRNAEQYPNLVAWLGRVATIKDHQEIYDGLLSFRPKAKL